jgi:hypothetical protein
MEESTNILILTWELKKLVKLSKPVFIIKTLPVIDREIKISRIVAIAAVLFRLIPSRTSRK